MKKTMEFCARTLIDILIFYIIICIAFSVIISTNYQENKYYYIRQLGPFAALDIFTATATEEDEEGPWGYDNYDDPITLAEYGKTYTVILVHLPFAAYDDVLRIDIEHIWK